MTAVDSAETLGQPTVDTADRLRVIWIELLNTPTVSDRDNFVELGGDSIAASLCINRIAGEFGVDLPITALLFEDADFGTLATELAAALSSAAPPEGRS